jgi:hypothetical protein
MQDAESFGNVIYARVDGEKAADLSPLGSSALKDQVIHFGDRGELGTQFIRKTQRPGQTGRWIRVNGEYLFPFIGVDLSKQGSEGGFAHAAFAGDSEFHRCLSTDFTDFFV